MKKIIYLVVFMGIILSSCKDFLKEYSQNDSYIEKVSDLDELLAGECYLRAEHSNSAATVSMSSFKVKNLLSFIYVLDDDIMENIFDVDNRVVTNSSNAYSELYNFYRWSEDPFFNSHGVIFTDPYWKEFYYRIAVLNSILAGADDLEEREESVTELNRVRAETHFLRAWNYFMLCNIYGMPYDKKNPDDPYGVPLKLVPEVLDKDFKRSTVGEVYEQVKLDLELALDYFKNSDPTGVKDVYVADINTVYAFLSRVYLYMEEYEKAIEAANNVRGASLQNLDEIIKKELSFAVVTSVETIFNQGSSVLYMLQPGEGERYYTLQLDIQHYRETREMRYDTIWRVTDFSFSYSVSEDLADLYDENDLRYRAFFNRGAITGSLSCRKYRISTATNEYDPDTHKEMKSSFSSTASSSCCWIRYSEVLLNKMEAQACVGDAGVHTVLNEFLSTRYEIIPEIPSSGMELIKFIRNERRKELCFEGHRWFDIRRYAVSSFPEKIEVEHKCFDRVMDVDNSYFIRNVGTRTLKAYDESTKGHWTVPIPWYVLDDNHGLISNYPRNSGVQSNIN